MAIDVEKMKQRLETLRTELEDSLKQLPIAQPFPDNANAEDDTVGDTEDLAVDSQEMQQEQSIKQDQEYQLSEVKAALQRIQDGTYGRCVVDGAEIPVKRLEAIPWASRCIKDEEAWEQEQLRNAPSLPQDNQGTRFS
ncbi:TraR/DksA family transcriptional regulator [Dictyobacter arantiisoli]|nr:TraR/DksA C4-type zinc finger protein [Dictyobacter arantiisoli]